MPRSKRNKEVHLTNVKKQGKERKNDLMENIREAVEKYENVVLVEFDQQRNVHVKEVRQRFANGRLFFGKNKLMQLALGTTPETEVEENLHQMAQEVVGQVGLLLTDEPIEAVQKYFEEFRPVDFAKSGFVATRTISLPRGEDTFKSMSHAIEPHLRTLGLPTQLNNGKIIMLGDHVVCTEGKELTVDSAQILKLLDIKMSAFQLTPKAVYSKKDHTFRDLCEDEDEDDEEDMEC